MTIMRWDDWIFVLFAMIFLLVAAFYVGYCTGYDVCVINLSENGHALYQGID